MSEVRNEYSEYNEHSEYNETWELEDPLSQELLAAHQWRITALFVLLGIIIPLGVVLNALAFTVLVSAKSLRNTTTTRYLIALSIADTVYLIGEFLVWLNMVDTHGQILGVEFTETSAFWCRFQHFLRYYGKFASIWLTVAITLEKCMAIFYPVTFDKVAIVRITSVIIIGIYVIGALLTSFTFWQITVVHSDTFDYSYCTYAFSNSHYEEWNWAVNKIGSVFLPCGLLLLFTIAIVIKLNQYSKSQHESSVSRNTNEVPVEKQLSRMLITVAVATLVLRIPYTIMYIPYDKRYDFWGYEHVAYTWFEFHLHVAKDVCFVLATANFAVNFFLFYVSGRTFRKNLKSMLMCWRSRQSVDGMDDTLANTDQNIIKSESDLSINEEGVKLLSQTNL